MEKKKLTPHQMVARELARDHGGQGSMTMAEYEKGFRGILDLLHDRALEALEGPADDHTALRYSQEYCAFAELMSCFGTALIAFEDLEEAEFPDDDDPIDDGSSHGVN